MTTRTMTAAAGGEDYTSSEGLRALLTRLHEEGPGAWRTDPAAAELMQYAAEKYAALARKHHLDPWEAVSAAFEVMRTRSAREACDPWAVVTHAVQRTCWAEERGQGLLCSVHQARKNRYTMFHDAERLSDRENSLDDYHEAFQVTDPALNFTDDDEDDVREDDAASEAALGVTSAMSAMEDAIAFVTLLGWPPQMARSCVEHICGMVARAGSRQSAFESLRRDKHARAMLDVPSASWSALVRVLIGNHMPGVSATRAGRGILLRLLIGESLPVLLRDDDLVLTVALSAPKGGGRA
ncbi:hypothetical protein ACT3TZ_10930 [Brachybacterium sp. AOP25-B2-12]|uniref:hypothetical protein n=1 Tax=Brachybacterium sp. AOP25-B2-12 TaxID=3457710 RepID=UPI004034969F